MRLNYRQTLIEGLWSRLARHAQQDYRIRMFIIYELTRALSAEGDL